MKKVLIALDYDPNAQKVAELGFAMGKAMSAEVILMHVIGDPAFYSSTVYDPIMGFGGFVNTGMLDPDMVNNLKSESQQFLDKSKAHLGDDTIQTYIIEGDIADSIIEVAKELNIDVIVMGTHSRKWLENLVMGSVTEKVLRHTTTPLFIIPTKQENTN